jgi:type IV pilus assembly protein PilO
MKIGPREQIILSVAAVVIVLLAIGAFLVWPQVQQLGALDTKITAARSDVAASQALLAVRMQSKDRASETDAQWLRLSNLVPDGPDLPSLIVELQDAAFASGVQLISVTPSTVKPSAAYYTLPVQVQVIGTWADTVDYLQRLYKLNRGIRIKSSSSNRTTNSEQETKEDMPLPEYAVLSTIIFEAYMIPSTNPTATAPAPAAPTPAP